MEKQKYLDLRIDDYYGITLLGQSPVDYNWKFIGTFMTKSELVKYVINNKNELVANVHTSILLDTDSYGIFLDEDEEKFMYYYMTK